ncbi:MAG: hypothetical protein K9J81_09815 [Desulfohalobiaceae bacterium]|jgi:rubredoxin|nr:hypothetical protein [Desulfohalobiaceae bacterium]
MNNWKCSNCGYELQADTPPEQCPSCQQKCQFLDNTCYTPDCEFEGKDPRIGGKSK